MYAESWKPGVSYKKGVVRRWFGELWQSTIADNLDNKPSDGVGWELTNEQDLTDRVMIALTA